MKTIKKITKPTNKQTNKYKNVQKMLVRQLNTWNIISGSDAGTYCRVFSKK